MEATCGWREEGRGGREERGEVRKKNHVDFLLCTSFSSGVQHTNRSRQSLLPAQFGTHSGESLPPTCNCSLSEGLLLPRFFGLLPLSLHPNPLANLRTICRDSSCTWQFLCVNLQLDVAKSCCGVIQCEREKVVKEERCFVFLGTRTADTW